MAEAVREYSSLKEALLAVYGKDAGVCQKSPVSGGDINRAYLLRACDGGILFLKENAAENLDFFRKEAEGLQAIRQTGAISVPEVKACGTDGADAFLLMEYLSEGSRSRDFFEDFGQRLAAMHAADTSAYIGDGNYGFLSDNYIGAGYQENTPESRWTDFFIKRRLMLQIKRAERYFTTDEKTQIDRLLEKAADILTEPEKPALLHGDLWSGNYMTGPDGKAWLIDPAVYVGHPEADIAMTELFGGYPAAFYDAYFEAAGKQPGYEDRRDLYNLYHLLNHLNLFGSAYHRAVMSVVRRYTGPG
ncbi:MAG: fructosamine kinase family protein [Lachnospiraceae bacterium]|nr:fructosamine kinase family protein [Lachnospiraceae bacterium]